MVAVKSRWLNLKKIAAIVGALVALIWGVYRTRPVLHVEAQGPVEPGDPYKWRFVIINKGQLPARVTASCFIREVQFEKGYQAEAWSYTNDEAEQSWLEGNDGSFTIGCPQRLFVVRNPETGQGRAEFSSSADFDVESLSVQGLETLPVKATLAQVELEYWVLGLLPLKKEARLLGRRNHEGNLVWLPIAPSECLLKKEPQRLRFTLQRCESGSSEGASFSFSIGPGYESPQPCPEE